MKKFITLMATTLTLLSSVLIGCASTSTASAPKSIHPREYTFDLIDAGEKITVEYNQYGPNYQAKLDFTGRVKKDKPQAGW